MSVIESAIWELFACFRAQKYCFCYKKLYNRSREKYNVKNLLIMLKETRALQKKESHEFTLNDLADYAQVLKYHANLYYNDQSPIISDGEYDELFTKLQFLEEKFELKKKFSDSVWADVVESSFKKVAHSRPMISLGNTYDEQDLEDFNTRIVKLSWQSNVEYTLEFKFDGLGIELIYDNWELIQAITRGNGVQWEDVTQNIMQISNIPKKIAITEYLEIRGEVVMPLSSFESLNAIAREKGEKVFSNPRNAAAGSIRMKDNRVTKQRKLQFFAYDSPSPHSIFSQSDHSSYYSFIHDLEKLWFGISSYFMKCSSIGEVISNIENFWDVKNTIDFEIDGLVIKVEQIDLWEEIGFTEHHPRYAIAYKFPSEMFSTEIISVEHQVWRTWSITPVANLEPVNIGGAMIARATLHNYDEVEKLWVHVWDSVFLKRAWEVIPKITSLASHPAILWDAILPPVNCPSCNSIVLKDEDKVRYYCPNFNACPKQVAEKLIWSVGKWGFNIDGFWKRQVEIFLDEGILTDIVSIFEIQNHREAILELEWFQEKSVDKLISAIQDAKNMDVVTLLSALGISWVGKKTAKTLAKLITSSDSEILTWNIDFEVLEALDDIWPEIAKNVIEYFSDDKNKQDIQTLLSMLDITYYQVQVSTWVYSDKKMCITGSFMQDWKKTSRDDLVLLLEKNGWEFVGSVSKKTDYLLAWEKAWSKLKKAQDLWIEVLNLEEFMESIK